MIFLKIDFDRLLQLRNFHHRSVSGFAENCTLAGISSLSTATRFAGLAAEGERGNPRGPKNRFYPLIAKKPLNNMVQGLLPISASHPPLPPSERKRSYASEKRTLLLLACLVWTVAGFNVFRIGILAYATYWSVVNLILSLLVFALFQRFIFGRLVRKHTARILGYQEERQFFLKFFDRKAFLIMAVMIVGGISLRGSGLAPERFIAVFYSGLGASLLLAGILFGRNYFKAPH